MYIRGMRRGGHSAGVRGDEYVYKMITKSEKEI
jgi:hypothetical protein